MAQIIRARHTSWVLTLLTIVTAIAGLLLLAVFPWTGAGCCMLAYWLHRQSTDEESFITGLVLMASLGVAAEVVRFVIEH